MNARAEITSFTGLRGVAAWAVVAYHMRELLPGTGTAPNILAKGYLAVDLFFIMSGFVLALSYAATFEHRITPRTYARFIGLRLARIYPLHLTVLALFLTLPLALLLSGREPDPATFSPLYFVQSLFLLQNWGFASKVQWNVPAWSISTEMLFYLLFPLIVAASAWIVRRRTALAAVTPLLLLATAVWGYNSGYLGGRFASMGAVRCLLECTIGLCLFHAARFWPATRAGSAALLGASALLALLFGAGLAPDYAVMPLAFVLLLWAILEPSAAISRLLSTPLLSYLGRISFSTYLVHYLVKDWARLLFVGRLPPTATFLIYIAAVAAASAILYALIEVPGRRWGRRMTDTLIPATQRPGLDPVRAIRPMENVP